MSGSFSLYAQAAARDLDVRASAMLDDGGMALMQRAGQAAWQGVLRHWPQARRIVVVCGPGNNGGDGYVLARHAQRTGRSVQVVHLREHVPRTPLAQQACTEYVAAGGEVAWFQHRLPVADLVVDALFGIGLERAPEGGSAALIDAINAQAVPVFALDVPSGVDAQRCSVPGNAVIASRTLQFIVRHVGLHTGDALEYTGVLELDEIDVPPTLLETAPAAAEWLHPEALARWVLPRRRNTHKGESGRVLCIGGDDGAGGAIVLCAEAALRSGAGLLQVATRPAHVGALLARRPEAMCHAVESEAELQPLLARADVIALGPGLGQGEWGQALYARALAAGKPLVLDADALNLLARRQQRFEDAILTPHPGEAARLLDVGTAQIQHDRLAAARALAERYAAVVVLKGAGTVVAQAGGIPRVVATGNPGMAVGGMGDVLTGVIAALRAQGLSAFDAASAGALLHGWAGDQAAQDGERGMLPSDLMHWLQVGANP